MTKLIHFQWQNEILCKSIYPMREPKLRDFLTYYQEVDLWAEYKDKQDLNSDIEEYTKAQKLAAAAAYKMYKSKRDYFMRPDARAYYREFKPIDETELAEINKLHNTFVTYWPKDIRGEKSFVQMQIDSWVEHRNLHRDWIKSRKRRQAAMDPNHPKYAPETEELQAKENVSLPMAEHELGQLRAFLATYEVIEKRKLDWYWMVKRGQAPADMTEAEFLVQYKPENPPTARDIAIWKAQAYEESLEGKDQYQLLEAIRERFERHPDRYPLWLGYMVVHFSGMRYASAHGSWADPKDLLARLRAPKIEDEIKALDDAAVEKFCQEKITAYETEGGSKPALAEATEKEWTQRIGWYLPNLKVKGPKTRRQGLTDLRKTEDAYETMSMTTEAALERLLAKKDEFPGWAWKQIVALTPLRLTEVSAPDWEKLTPQEEQESYSQENYPLRAIIDAWKNHDATAWRAEHGRAHELIVTRAVCNETAEHIQHLRGHQPPGGLTPKPKWYLANEKEQKIPGDPAPYFVKATSAEEYTQGASVLWLRFVDKKPDAWQIAKPVLTKDKVGLLPDAFTGEKKGKGKDKSGWTYKTGEIITRERVLVSEDKKAKKGKKKTKTKQQQWLRWIHEATVAEVAETAEGPVIITYETALPDDDKGTSAIGTFKMPLRYFLSDFMVDGNEDTYNRSFVGYVPEGQVPVEHIQKMLDWDKILSR